MEGRPFSKRGSRSSAAHIRLESLPDLNVWRAIPFQNRHAHSSLEHTPSSRIIVIGVPYMVLFYTT
eukprot:3590752-Pyramimonas_sp.AAC.1